MTHHRLMPDIHTLHGAFSRNRAPVLRVAPGDTIEAMTLDAGWGLEAPKLDGTPRKLHPRPEDPAERGHALLGPVWIEGAKPGMTLVVHIEALTPGDYGYTYSGGFLHRIYDKLQVAGGETELMLWALDAERMTGVNTLGHRLRLKPFLGVLGMPPPEDGLHATAPPRIWGGNIDCKDLVAGTRLYLPIPVEGGLFSFGDGHAIQGHGEVSETAVECAMAHVRLRLEIEQDLVIDTPRAWTPAGWLTFGFHADLEQAALIALDAMVNFMMTQHAIESRKQALALATAIVDLHITQIANPVMGVHAFMAHDALI